MPSALATPIVNPALGGVGAPPIPYLSVSQYTFAPTAMNTGSLVKGTPTQNTQALADTLARASAWANDICFGADPASKGASLAASLSVEGALVSVRGAQLRLVCDYKPILEVVGVEVGPAPGATTSISPATADAIVIGRRTISIPYYTGPAFGRNATFTAGPIAGVFTGQLYATWSYVNGYPHTKLAAPVAAGATTCEVAATDGNGGLWGVYPASGGFLGTQLTIFDGAATESVFVTGVTPNGATATLTTTAFANAHTSPPAPDFLPVTGIPSDVQQAVISLATCLIKTRGARALVMPGLGGVPQPSQQAFAQAGALEDYSIAVGILRHYAIVAKSKN